MYVGTDHPTLKYLNKYVKIDISTKWYDIGVELLDDEDVPVLKRIKADHGRNSDECTAKMLELWLEKKPDTTWNDLIQTLREPNIKFETLASKLESLLCKGTYSEYNIAVLQVK